MKNVHKRKRESVKVLPSKAKNESNSPWWPRNRGIGVQPRVEKKKKPSAQWLWSFTHAVFSHSSRVRCPHKNKANILSFLYSSSIKNLLSPPNNSPLFVLLSPAPYTCESDHDWETKQDSPLTAHVMRTEAEPKLPLTLCLYLSCV